MKKSRLLLFLFFMGQMRGHQPRIIESDTTVINNPEVSQAFYASKPGTFVVDHSEPFSLYAQILRPKIGDLDKNVNITINKDGAVVAAILGDKGNWNVFHEPFANDDYYQGPDIKILAQGKYTINVQAEGKYVLVVGEKEKWPLSEIAKTIYNLPRLKLYFEKSPLLAYWNLSGAFLLSSLATTVTLLLLARLVVKKFLSR